MKTVINRIVATAMVALLPLASANAQLDDILKHGESSGLGAAGSALSAESITGGSIGNVAGVLEFCVKNNYLGGREASAVKDKLMDKIPGGAGASDTGYKEGAKGVLTSGDGKRFDLSASGMKANIAKQACDKMLAQGKSLL